MTRDVVLYATDTMADWEYAYLTTGLAMAEQMQPGRYRLLVLGDGTDPVTTGGGLRLLPDADLDQATPADTALVILPGGDTWESGHDRVLDLTRATLAAGGTVAGICGATYALARTGFLDDRRHTSNAPEFLTASGYRGAEHYVDAAVVHDRGVITAPATKPVDFAAAIFRDLELFPAPIIDAWYGLYTTGDKKYYEQLTTSAA